MPDKLSPYVRPLFFNVLLWVCGVALLLISKDALERASDAISDSSLDLVLVLSAYLLLFLLSPIRAWVNRRLYKISRRHTPSPPQSRDLNPPDQEQTIVPTWRKSPNRAG